MKRFWEIDFLRGTAIILMIISNFMFDLVIFAHYDFSGLWSFLLVIITASTFIFLVGLSLTISFSRIGNKRRKEICKKYFLRGAGLFSIGLLITAITWIFFNEGTIYFGVLHLIGISIILAIPFIRLRYVNFFLGILINFLGVLLWNMRFDFPWLLWLGFNPGFYTFDYFPLLPWFGVVLIGIFSGNMLYPNGKRVFRIRDLSSVPIIKQFCFLGRNSLKIYLIHQPIFVGLIYLFIR